jgi:hypothetical protein
MGLFQPSCRTGQADRGVNLIIILAFAAIPSYRYSGHCTLVLATIGLGATLYKERLHRKEQASVAIMVLSVDALSLL